MSYMSTEDRATTVRLATTALPRRSFAALFIAVAPYMFEPDLKAFTMTAHAFGPSALAIASVPETIALLRPALRSCWERTDTKKEVPATLTPHHAAFFAAMSRESPLQTLMPKAITALTPNADAATTAPFVASYFSESMLPALAMFRACW